MHSEHFRHAALEYRTPDELAAAVAGVVEAGRRARAAVLVAVAGANLDFLRIAVGPAGRGTAWADISRTGRNPARLTALIRQFTDEHQDRPAWCVHEPAWPARAAEEMREVHRHEAMMNLALARTPARLLCPYDLRLGAAVLGCARQTHPVMVRDGRWQPSPSFGGDGVLPADCDRPLTGPPPDAYTVTYTRDIAAVRKLITMLAAAAGLADRQVIDLVLAVSELAANTLTHTSGPGTLTIWETPAEVVCQIHDNGHITDPLAGTRRPKFPGTGPAGLWAVHQACDLAEIRSGPAGTTIRLHMRRI
jgi:anti-sigma regulatory factor (Ser/Thr protein kinase)